MRVIVTIGCETIIFIIAIVAIVAFILGFLIKIERPQVFTFPSNKTILPIEAISSLGWSLIQSNEDNVSSPLSPTAKPSDQSKRTRWTKELNTYFGNRWAVYQAYVKDQVEGMGWTAFKKSLGGIQ